MLRYRYVSDELDDFETNIFLNYHEKKEKLNEENIEELFAVRNVFYELCRSAVPLHRI